MTTYAVTADDRAFVKHALAQPHGEPPNPRIASDVHDLARWMSTVLNETAGAHTGTVCMFFDGGVRVISLDQKTILSMIMKLDASALTVR